MSRFVATAVACGTLAVALAGCGGGGAGHAQGMKAVWTVKGKSPDDLALYWTVRRMASAKPYEPNATKVVRQKPTPARLPYDDRAWGAGPTTREGGQVVGKVFFEERGVAYFCTGTAVYSDNRSVVMTSGHCAADGGKCPKARDCRPHQNWIFVPAYKKNASCHKEGPGCRWGRFVAKVLYAPDEWLQDGNHRYDFAAVAVEPQEQTVLLTNHVGDVVPAFDAQPEMLLHRGYALFGYPQNPPFNGGLRVCLVERARRDESRYEWFRGATHTGSEPGPPELTTGCNMTAGADGGPWLTPLLRIGRTGIVSVSSFSSTGDRLSGTYLGEVAKRTFQLAEATKVEGK
jgi:hypothetical protein